MAAKIINSDCSTSENSNINSIKDLTSVTGDKHRGSNSLQELKRTQEVQGLSGLSQICSSHIIQNIESSPVGKVPFTEELGSRYRSLHHTLTEFILAFMVEQPNDIVAFALQHFRSLQEMRHQRASSHSSELLIAKNFSSASAQSKTRLRGGDDRRKTVWSERYTLSELEDSDTASAVALRRQSVVNEKTPEQIENISETVTKLLTFQDLTAEQLKGLLDAMFPIHVSNGDVVSRYGDEDKLFYVIEAGTFILLDGNEKVITKLENRGSFGELSLLYNIKRTATLKATSDGLLWAIDHGTFRRILLQHTYKKHKRYKELVENVPMFKELNTLELISLAEALKPIKFPAGATIIKQGDEGNGMYFIEEGEVTVWKETLSAGQKNSSGEMLMTKLTKGQYFGELALLMNQKRRASVYAETDVTLAYIDRDAFERLLGKCIDILNRNIENYNFKDPALVSYLAEVSRSRKSLLHARKSFVKYV